MNISQMAVKTQTLNEDDVNCGNTNLNEDVAIVMVTAIYATAN